MAEKRDRRPRNEEHGRDLLDDDDIEDDDKFEDIDTEDDDRDGEVNDEEAAGQGEHFTAEIGCEGGRASDLEELPAFRDV